MRIVFIAAWLLLGGSVVSGQVVDVRNYGAIGDGKTMNTAAFNRAIHICAQQGGGSVVVPAGVYVSGTIVLENNITLVLEENARIVGTTDLSEYRSFIQRKEDVSEPINLIVQDSSSWFKSLVLLNGVHDVVIRGFGTIDGGNVTDPHGEEGRRGPHGIFINESQRVTISGIRVERAGNYNILGTYLEDARFLGLTVAEGSDGIHIRQGKDLLIGDCRFYTRDDAIAGGYWRNMLIRDCAINTSCNGIRLILPATGLEIRDCEMNAPGLFGHHRGSPAFPWVVSSLAGIILQPGAWGHGAGRLDSVYIHDIRIRDFKAAFMALLNEGNQGGSIRLERIVATGIGEHACSIEAWADGSRFEKVEIRDVRVDYAVRDPAALSVSAVVRPGMESRSLPYWGWYIRNVDEVKFDHVSLHHTGVEERPCLGFEGVGRKELSQVDSMAKDGGWVSLLDTGLRQWGMYLSYAHRQGYKGDAPKDKNGAVLAPAGFGINKKDVFSVRLEEGQPVLRISGEIYGCLYTLKEYENYHIRLQVRWGRKKWPPRLGEPRDAGLVYHSHGVMGSDYWRSWMPGHEFQIMEGGMGDYWAVGATGANIRMHYPVPSNEMAVYDSSGILTRMGAGGTRNGFVQHGEDEEKSSGEWNTLELICYKDRSIHIVNGKVVLVTSGSSYREGELLMPLVRGRIQLQSEAAEVYFRDIRIRSIDRAPAEYACFLLEKK